ARGSEKLRRAAEVERRGCDELAVALRLEPDVMRPPVIQFSRQVHLPALLPRFRVERHDMRRFERAAPVEHDAEPGIPCGRLRWRIEYRDGAPSDTEGDHGVTAGRLCSVEANAAELIRRLGAGRAPTVAARGRQSIRSGARRAAVYRAETAIPSRARLARRA